MIWLFWLGPRWVKSLEHPGIGWNDSGRHGVLRASGLLLRNCCREKSMGTRVPLLCNSWTYFGFKRTTCWATIGVQTVDRAKTPSVSVPLPFGLGWLTTSYNNEMIFNDMVNGILSLRTPPYIEPEGAEKNRFGEPFSKAGTSDHVGSPASGSVLAKITETN